MDARDGSSSASGASSRFSASKISWPRTFSTARNTVRALGMAGAGVVIHEAGMRDVQGGHGLKLTTLWQIRQEVGCAAAAPGSGRHRLQADGRHAVLRHEEIRRQVAARIDAVLVEIGDAVLGSAACRRCRKRPVNSREGWVKIRCAASAMISGLRLARIMVPRRPAGC